MLGHVLSLKGRHDEATAEAKRARALDPLSALSHTMSSQIAFCARDLDEAVRNAREALHAEPNDWVAHWQLGQTYEQMDRVEEALEEFAEASRLSGGNTKPVSVSGYTLATRGRAREARVIVPSRARSRRKSADSSSPTVARCFWTRSATSRWSCSRNSSACCKNRSSSGWGHANDRVNVAWSRRPIATCGRWWRIESSAAISTIA